MSDTLVIVESPAKAKTIGKFLGSKFKVVASNGHVRDLPKSQIGVKIDQGFEPKYITLRGRGDVLERIRKEAKAADKVFLATDPDREGEAISWHLAQVLNLDEKSKCRIEFNEITATSDVPPPMSRTMEPRASPTGMPAPIAAAIGSSTRNTSRAPALSADSLIARRSTWVDPAGTHTSTRGLGRRKRLLCTLRMKCLSISSV